MTDYYTATQLAEKTGDDEIFNLRQAAEYLGYSVNHFKTLNIPHAGKGKARRWRRSTLINWFAEQEKCHQSASSGASGKIGPAKSASRKNTQRKSASAPPPISEALELLTSEKRKLLPAA